MEIATKIIIISLFFTIPALAEEAVRGRLPDGRAFRRDVSGNQIVDYIAELELGIDALNRKVNGLEYELEEKQKLIGRLKRTGAKDSKFVERDIVESWKDDTFKIPANKHAVSPEKDCFAEVAEIKNELNRTKKDLNTANERAADLKQQLNGQKEELDALKVKYKLPINIKSDPSTRGSLKLEPLTSATKERPAIAKKRAHAVDALRGSLITELNALKRLVQSRDKLFKNYSARSSKKVSFKPTPCRSSRKNNLSMIYSGLASAESVYELASWKRDIKEIHTKVKDDIALIERMERY